MVKLVFHFHFNLHLHLFYSIGSWLIFCSLILAFIYLLIILVVSKHNVFCTQTQRLAAKKDSCEKMFLLLLLLLLEWQPMIILNDLLA